MSVYENMTLKIFNFDKGTYGQYIDFDKNPTVEVHDKIPDMVQGCKIIIFDCDNDPIVRVYGQNQYNAFMHFQALSKCIHALHYDYKNNRDVGGRNGSWLYGGPKFEGISYYAEFDNVHGVTDQETIVGKSIRIFDYDTGLIAYKTWDHDISYVMDKINCLSYFIDGLVAMTAQMAYQVYNEEELVE